MNEDGKAPFELLDSPLPSTSGINLRDRLSLRNSLEDYMSDISEGDPIDPFEGSDSRDKDYEPKEDSDAENGNEENEEPVTVASKKRTRWNKADKSTWKRNILKKRRNLGRAFTNKKGLQPAKLPQYVDCTQCRFKCSQKFSEEERVELCFSYWKLEVFSRKKDFILQNVKACIPQRQRQRKENAKARTNAKEFHFFKNGIATRVCQKFFLKTLCISNGPLNKAFENQDKASGLYNGDDKRGRHIPSNKITTEDKQVIKNTLKVFL